MSTKNEISRNSGEIIQEALQKNFDIIILDVMVPGKDGPEPLSELRDFKEVPFIMLQHQQSKLYHNHRKVFIILVTILFMQCCHLLPPGQL